MALLVTLLSSLLPGAPGSVFYLGLGFLFPVVPSLLFTLRRKGLTVFAPSFEGTWACHCGARAAKLSPRPERPDFLFRSAFWSVAPRSAVCAPRALRRGGGICFF